ncbi:hypothetical protein [Zymomonas mobilis]|uniref:hypothetical protein n=1 Tax=Zymomonas mobilis TaxID=542 RepID=UPI0011528CB2|nr:hypothetical protein [Zymomonas mobilis]
MTYLLVSVGICFLAFFESVGYKSLGVEDAPKKVGSFLRCSIILSLPFVVCLGKFWAIFHHPSYRVFKAVFLASFSPFFYTVR